MARFFFCALCVLVSISLPVSAQQASSQINGVLLGPDNEPVAFSTVMLLTKDSVYIKGDISKDDGTFLIAGVSPAEYRLLVQNVEYQSYYSSLLAVAANERKNVGQIRMSKSVVQLNEVVVTEKKAVVEIHPDKMVFNVAGSVNASGNNALDLFAKTPGVIIDPDNNIIVQGKGGVLIYINGRPTRLSGTDLTAMLQSMQSDNIESIEVITNPSSRFDAEGNAGIINIRLKRNPDRGYNGTVVSNYSKGTFRRFNTGVSMNYRGGKVNVSGDVNRIDNINQTDFNELREQNGFLIDDNSWGKNHNRGLNISSNLDYNINAKHSLSTGVMLMTNTGLNKVRALTPIVDLETNDLEILSAGSVADGETQNLLYNLSYQFVPSDKTTINADVSFGDYMSRRNTLQPNAYLQEDGVTEIRRADYAFDSDTDISLWSAKVDLHKKFGKITFDAGGKYSYINTNNDFIFFNFVNGVPVEDMDRSNNFTYLEKVAALYAVVNTSLMKNVTINAGVRMENTVSEGLLKSDQPTLNSSVIRDYTDFFPNVGIAYDDGKNHRLSVSLGRRITRPNYQSLNPFETKESEISFMKGNPFLRPNYTMNYEIAYSLKNKLVIKNTYSVITDFFANILKIEGEKGTFLIPQNMQRSLSNGFSVSYSLSPLKGWDVNTSGNYNYVMFDGNFEGVVVSLEAHTYNLNIQNNFSLPGNLQIELTYNHNSPFIWRGSIKIRRMQALNFGVRKEFFKKKLQLRATISDIFNTNSDYRYFGNYGGINFDGIMSVDNRRAGIGLTYKFGNQKSGGAKRKKSALDDEMKRLGGE